MERVWVYQSNRRLTDQEAASIQQQLEEFISNWAAHGTPLKAAGEVRENLFVILRVDEKHLEASGCSIDASVRVIRKMEEQFGLDLFDRQLIAWQEGAEVQMGHFQQLPELYREGRISDDTLMVNKLDTRMADFEQQWKKPLRETPYRRFVQA